MHMGGYNISWFLDGVTKQAIKILKLQECNSTTINIYFMSNKIFLKCYNWRFNFATN